MESGYSCSAPLSLCSLVVALEYKLHIFDISTMKVLQAIETTSNPKGKFSAAGATQRCTQLLLLGVAWPFRICWPLRQHLLVEMRGWPTDGAWHRDCSVTDGYSARGPTQAHRFRDEDCVP